jgi:hypothetical protein
MVRATSFPSCTWLQTKFQDLGRSSLVQYLPIMCETLGSMPSTHVTGTTKGKSCLYRQLACRPVYTAYWLNWLFLCVHDGEAKVNSLCSSFGLGSSLPLDSYQTPEQSTCQPRHTASEKWHLTPGESRPAAMVNTHLVTQLSWTPNFPLGGRHLSKVGQQNFERVTLPVLLFDK